MILTGDGFGIRVLLVAIAYVYTVHLLLEEFCSLFIHCPVANPTAFPAGTSSFLLTSHREVKKGGTALSWGTTRGWGYAGCDILQDAGN